jgi:cell division septation protein DedD
MKKRFVLSALALTLAAGLCACADREAVITHSGPPVYRDQDLEEAAASVGHHMDTSERLRALETDVTAIKVELSRLSGAAQRIEARQLQTGGVGPEPASAAATPLYDEKGHSKHAARGKKPAPEKTVAEGTDVGVSDKALAAIQDTANADLTAPPAGPKPTAAPPPEVKPAEEKASSASPAPAVPTAPAAAPPVASDTPSAPPAASASMGNPGFGLQLGAYASPDRAIAAWTALKNQGGNLLADLLPKHEAVTVGDKTMYRLKAGPLPDANAARTRCDGLKAQNIECMVAPFSGEWPSS